MSAPWGTIPTNFYIIPQFNPRFHEFLFFVNKKRVIVEKKAGAPEGTPAGAWRSAEQRSILNR